MKSKNIVFVHGAFGWGKSEMVGLPYWGKALKIDSPGFKLHEASCGPVSSFHDRACEVVAQIRGSKIDYGREHSVEANHQQFSDDYTGKPYVEGWSEENPVILIAHSAGAQTCLQLQQLLAEDYWGFGSDANWVEAIVSISGVLNGSTLTYMLGCDQQTGLLTGPIGENLGKFIQTLALITGNSHVYDFDLDQWLGREHRFDIKEMINALNESEFTKGTDNMAYDLTLQGCYKANQKFKTNPGTYYLSIVTENTVQGEPEKSINPTLWAPARYQGKKVNFDINSNPIPGWGKGDLSIEKWRENDGAVSSISQKYPFTVGTHPVGGEGIINRGASLEKGKWYFENAHSITTNRFDHLDVCFGYVGNIWGFNHLQSHKVLYEKIYKLLTELE